MSPVTHATSPPHRLSGSDRKKRKLRSTREFDHPGPRVHKQAGEDVSSVFNEKKPNHFAARMQRCRRVIVVLLSTSLALSSISALARPRGPPSNFPFHLLRPRAFRYKIAGRATAIAPRTFHWGKLLKNIGYHWTINIYSIHWVGTFLPRNCYYNNAISKHSEIIDNCKKPNQWSIRA